MKQVWINITLMSTLKSSRKRYIQDTYLKLSAQILLTLIIIIIKVFHIPIQKQGIIDKRQ